MKNFKKVLSLVLALTMVLSTMTVAFAAVADTTEAKAEVLYMLRLFDGYDDDAAYTPALEDVATREQAMKLIATAFGWEIDLEAVSDFTDVTDWAQPYVKVAFDMGVTEGYDAEAGIFGGTDPVSPRQIKTFFDRMLTGEDTWEANAALSEEPATRGEMVDAMWDALMSVKTGEVAPLIDGVITGTDAARKTAADAADMTMGEVALDSGLQVAPALTVMTIAAVNKSTIKVDFDTAVDTLAVENVAVMVGEVAMTVETAVLNPAGTTATITIAGLAYGDEVAITLTGLSVDGVALEDVKVTVTVPALNDLYELAVSSDAALNTIKSDGATKTMLSAKLVEKATGDVKNLDGVVNFNATKGGLAQSEVTLEDGVANVQLTSAASDASVTSYITVTIVDSPAATEYEGITGQFEVYFKPDVVDDATTTFVQVSSAESNQADRLFVTYSGDISASAYKAALIAEATAVNSTWDTWAEAQLNGYAVIEIDNADVALDDVLQKGANVLEFILDTDTAGSDAPASTTEIKVGWGSASPAYLRDNALHTLSYTASLGSLVLANTTGVQFIVTDAKRPFIYGVTAANQVSFKVTFSESMAEDMVEGARGIPAGNTAAGVNPYFLIDGKQVYLTNSATGASAAEIANAAANNYVLVRDLYVGDYVAGDHDTRAVVTFRLDNTAALAAGGHIIQIANVADWAGMSDVNNRVTTQTFDFTVAADTSKPVPTLEVQSPEQWKLSFDETVVLDAGSADAFEIYKADDSATKLVDGTDYLVTDISSTSQSIYLIEMLEDWTEYYNTSGTAVNYWNSTKNPYQLKIMTGEVADLLGNVADAATLTATLAIDVTSPIILSAVDKSTVVSTVAAGTAIRVTMNEPVQISLPDGIDVDLFREVTSADLTPSQQQTALDGSTNDPADPADNVPLPTFEFVKGDTTIEGSLTAISTAEDMVFDVTPATTLASGTWTLYIRNLTDDVGNAYNTQAYALVVPTGTTTSADTAIAWAAFDNGSDSAGSGVYDYLYIKFTKVMDATGASGVSRTTNYVFNGVALPTGSQVYSGITGITNGWDGVTIRMPRQAFLDTDNADATLGVAAASLDATSVLNVANNFKAADGQTLAGPFEVELTDTASVAFAEKDGLALNMIAPTGAFEAEYYNTSASALIGGAAVLATTVSDSGTDGTIDTAVFALSKAPTGLTVANKITVGGKTFVWSAGSTFVSDGAANEIATTATAGIAVTATNGGKMLSAGKIVDTVAPALIKAVVTSISGGTAGFGQDVNDKLALTFSEPVNTNFGVATAPTAAEIDALYVFSTGVIGGTAVLTANDLSSTASSTLTLTLNGGAAANVVTVAATVDAAAAPVADDIEDVVDIDILPAATQVLITVE